MGFPVACKNEEDPIKMKALEWAQHYSFIFQSSRAANSEVSDGIFTSGFAHVESESQ